MRAMQGSVHPTFGPLAGLRAAVAAREAAGLRRYLAPRAADEATLDLASNDYLGLSGDTRLAVAEVTQTLVDTGRGFIFDTGLAPPSAGAALAALRALRADPGPPGRARQAAARLAAAAAEIGLTVTGSGRRGVPAPDGGAPR
jgi:7-keto-8-aminopelargonate synthetase-like enzyme